MPSSYIAFLIETITTLTFYPELTNTLTSPELLALLFSVWVSFRKWDRGVIRIFLVLIRSL